MDKNISVLMQKIQSKTGFTQYKLAELLGTSQPTVMRILRGQKNCELELYRRIIALYLNVGA